MKLVDNVIRSMRVGKVFKDNQVRDAELNQMFDANPSKPVVIPTLKRMVAFEMLPKA